MKGLLRVWQNTKTLNPHLRGRAASCKQRKSTPISLMTYGTELSIVSFPRPTTFSRNSTLRNGSPLKKFCLWKPPDLLRSDRNGPAQSAPCAFYAMLTTRFHHHISAVCFYI